MKQIFGQLVDGIYPRRQTELVERNSRAPVRRQHARTQDRKRELVEIAYRLIADKGLEGFRTRQVAGAAGMDNGTLHYHFASKETLIQSVVEYLMQDLQTNRCDQGTLQDRTALDELHMEFEDIRLRLHESQANVLDRKSTRLNSSHRSLSRMPSSA